MKKTCLAIVLAAGEGTRMRSARPKVLHAVAGRSLLAHVLDAVRGAGSDRDRRGGRPRRMTRSRPRRGTSLPDAEMFVQTERRGTAHAVLAARRPRSTQGADDVLVIFGDTPLIRPQTLDDAARRAGRGRGGRGARIPPGRSDRLRPAGDARAANCIAIREEPTRATASARSRSATAA